LAWPHIRGKASGRQAGIPYVTTEAPHLRAAIGWEGSPQELPGSWRQTGLGYPSASLRCGVD